MTVPGSESARHPDSRRFAVVCSDGRLQRWQALCVQQLVDAGVGVAVLVVNVRSETRQPDDLGLVDGRRHPYRSRRALRRSRALEPVDVATIVPGVQHLSCGDASGGLRANKLVKTVRGHGLDFILWFAHGPSPRHLACAARSGLWTYRHGGERECTAPVSCALRLIATGDVTEVRLVRIGATPAEDTTLHRGYFGTREAAGANLDRVLLGGSDWCLRTCRELTAKGTLERRRATVSTRTNDADGLTPTASRSHGAARVSEIVRRLWRALFLLEVWNVAVVDTPVAEVLRSGRTDGARWLTALPRFTFRADPFAVMRGGELQLLYEAYDYRTLKGTIAGGRFDPQHASVEASPAMSRPEHMSYPFLVEADGELYCIPETSEANSAALLRATEFPCNWQQVATVIDGVAVVDATVFRHGGRWWLLATDEANGPNEKLYGWYADRLEGPWTAHLLNPLKCDIRSSRPAGRPFTIDGTLYRPAQDCSQGYGGAITVNRILTLTPTEFDEEAVARIAPDRDGPYPDGLHTLCPVDGRVVIDGMRRVFFPFAGLVKLLEARASARRRAGSASSVLPPSMREVARSHPATADAFAWADAATETAPIRRQA